LILAFSAPAQQLVVRGGPEILDGEPPDVVASALAPGDHVTVHSYRRVRYGQGDKPQIVVAHAFGEFAANADGSVVVSKTAPVRGTWSGVDGMGLLWSGERMDEGAPELKVREVLIRLERGDSVLAERTVKMVDGADRLVLQTVTEGAVNGVFARPKDAGGTRLRPIILLHGSEGGTMEEARSNAVRFAQLGYAAFGLNYFSWFDKSLPVGLMNIPIETLSNVRDWLAKQPGVDAAKVGVWGASKGGEMALIAAAYLPWIDRVVACVPSSVVWSGFGRALREEEASSSWTWQGRSLPFIPYDHYEDALGGKLSAASVHARSLDKASEPERAAARIPAERSEAKFLIFGSERDQVWPSAMMVRQIAASFDAAGKSGNLESHVFPQASHFICGVGAEAVRINPVKKPEGNDPLPEADAHASHAAWEATTSFLRR
jgi:dienelactone hydrolase